MGKSVVIVGGGYAGAQVAAGVGDRLDVTVISSDNFVLFTPMLAEVASAELDPRHITSPLRQLCPRARLVEGTVTAIHTATGAVTVDSPFGRSSRRFQADALVIATGSVPSTFGVPGVTEHALAFKTIGDALRIRNRLLGMLEAATVEQVASLTKVAIVGAGYSGAELAAALADFLGEAAARFYPTAPVPEVFIVDQVDRVVPTMPARLGRKAARALERRHVRVRLGRKVAAVDGGGLVLDDGTRVDAATVIWSAGVRTGPAAALVDLPTGSMGRIKVDGHLRAAPNVYALGDVAEAPDGRGGICPPTGQFALRQGRYLGRHLPSLLDGQPVRPFTYASRGELVSLGRRNAVGVVLGVPVSGFPAWWLWRSYYLLRLPTLARKLRVALDWTLDLAFPPDIARLPTSDFGPTPSIQAGRETHS